MAWRAFDEPLDVVRAIAVDREHLGENVAHSAPRSRRGQLLDSRLRSMAGLRSVYQTADEMDGSEKL